MRNDFVYSSNRPSADTSDSIVGNPQEGPTTIEVIEGHRRISMTTIHSLHHEKDQANEQTDLASTCSIGETGWIERINTRIIQRDQQTLNIRKVRHTVNTTMIFIDPFLEEERMIKVGKSDEHLQRH